jgi:hypothetical protein
LIIYVNVLTKKYKKNIEFRAWEALFCVCIARGYYIILKCTQYRCNNGIKTNWDSYVIVLHVISVSLLCFTFCLLSFLSSEGAVHSTKSDYEMYPPGKVCPQE